MTGLAELLAAVDAGDAAGAARIAGADPGLLEERGPDGATPILLAAYRGARPVQEALRPLKPALDLYEAAALGDLDRVVTLVEAEPSAIDRPAPDGRTALGLAAFFGRQAVVDWLLARGADATPPAMGPTALPPLHAAAVGRHLGIARALLAHGAVPDAPRHGGYTALHAAARNGHLELIALLLEHGADPHRAAADGATALSLARAAGHARAVTLLESGGGPSADAPFGLLCAIPEEIAHFGPHFVESEAETIGGFVFRRGLLDGRHAVVVECGIGKVNAAVVSTLLIERFGCRMLLFSGVAGGVDPALGIGDVVVGTRLVQHDYGALVRGNLRVYQPGVTPVPGVADTHGYALDPAVEVTVRAALDGLELPPIPAKATGGVERTPRITFGTIATGDQFVNCETTRQRLHERFGAAAVEMEGAAVAQVAERFGVPCLIIRSLSDLAGAESHMDFYTFVAAAARCASLLLRRVAAVL